VRPDRLVEDLGVYLLLPKRFEGRPLGVIVQTGEADEGLVAKVRRRDNPFDEVLARSDPDDLARERGRWGGSGHRCLEPAFYARALARECAVGAGSPGIDL